MGGLVNYWPVVSAEARDHVTGLSLTSNSAKYAPDRFGNANGSMRLDGTNYFQAPSGVYFSGDFSISAWIINYSCGPSGKWFELGNIMSLSPR